MHATPSLFFSPSLTSSCENGKLWKTSLYILAESSRSGILGNLYRFMPAISSTPERKRERVSVSETSVWSPLTASRSSIYYKDRAASRGRIIDKARRPASTAWTAADIIPQTPTISFISFRNRSPRHFLFNGNHYRARGNCSNDRVDTFFSPLSPLPKKSRRRDSRYVRFQNFEINKFIY